MPKFVVCPECEGEGYVGTLGAMTWQEMTEWYDEPEDYSAAHEASKEHCRCCNAQRVVTAEQIEEWNERLEYEAERAAEFRYGC